MTQKNRELEAQKILSGLTLENQESAIMILRIIKNTQDITTQTHNKNEPKQTA